MIYIAHRGLFEGPDKNLENKPSQIERAIKAGFDCEVDLWANEWEGKYELMLGHDQGSYQVDYHWLAGKPLWIHAKNLTALYWLTKQRRSFNYFWHQNDSFTMTSEGYIWTFPGNLLTWKSIDVVPEWHMEPAQLNNYDQNCYGVCSKYVGLMKKQL
jgi:hypothetical protein